MRDSSNRIVSVVVVTGGINDYLRSCLNSLKDQTYPELEAIVIDNSLKAGFSQEASRIYPFIKIYSNTQNLFYSEALNMGIKLSKGGFILCLNDDVTLESRFIEEALRGFFIDPKIGMVSGKILRPDGETLDSIGLFLSPWRTARERGYGVKDVGQFQKKEYIFGVNGAVAFYRREMLEDIKEDNDYFDSDFHIFYEDLDIAWRAQRFGWNGYYIPCAIAYHIRGGTVRMRSGIDKPYARRYLSDKLHVDLIKNRYLTIIKNESCLGFLLHIPFIALYDFVMWSYVLFFRPKLIKTFLSHLKHLKFALKKRRLTRKNTLFRL